MRIIIFGGTGFIGDALTRILLEDEHDVTVVTRKPEAYTQNISPKIKYVKWNGITVDKWQTSIDGADVIINLVGENIAGKNIPYVLFKRWDQKQKHSILYSRLNAGKTISQAIQSVSNKPKVLIQASAVGYYGDRQNDLLTEADPPGDDFLSGVCVQWEQSTAAIEQVGVRRIILRTAGVVMSTRDGALPFMLFPYRLFIGGHLGNGSQWMSWIHIDDEVNAIRFLLNEATAEGIYNICSPNPVTNKEFGASLSKILHRPDNFPIPAWALHLAIGEKAKLLLSSQKQVPLRLADAGYKFKYPDVDSALFALLKQQT